MKDKKMKEKLHQYIDNATGKQLKNILSIVEEDPEKYIVTKNNHHWEDEEFVNEMDRRMEEIESGKVKGIPWKEVHKEAIELLKKKGKKNG